MFFFAYRGEEENLSVWQSLVKQHAAWLNLAEYIELRRLDNNQRFAFAFLKHKTLGRHIPAQEDKNYLFVDVTPSAYKNNLPHQSNITSQLRWEDLTKNAQSNIIKFGIALGSGEIKVVVPPTVPDQIYFTNDSKGYVFSNDLRFLMRWTGLELDEYAIYALLQYGAIIPFTAFSKNIQRIPAGHTFTLGSKEKHPKTELFFQPGKQFKPDNEISNPEAAIQKTLDNLLARLPRSTGMYFSGGVDSALLAARLVELGRTDIKLINYAFSLQDPESQMAMQMAGHFGLPCEQIVYQPADVSTVLQRLGKDYSYPFGDLSVIPTNLMLHASFHLLEPSLTVIEGTGADGAFGCWMPHSRIASLPITVRKGMSAGYKQLKIWRQNSEIARIGFLARGSLQMSLRHLVVMAQSSLNVIAYAIPKHINQTLQQNIEQQLDVLSVGLDSEGRYSLLDLVHVCAGIFAAKSFDPLRRRGISPVYPFLEPPMVHLSTSLPYQNKCVAGEAKAPLKRLLAQNIPVEWIYRPKSGFTPPYQHIFTYPAVQEFINSVVMSPQNPVLGFCDQKTVKQMMERAQSGQSLNKSVYNFLWTLTFTSGWLHQLDYLH